MIVFGSVIPDLQDKFNILVDGRRIRYVGWLDVDSTYDYFSAADLVVFPGRHSVFWEQVVGQGIPMLVKYWDGTTHIDLGGNVEFLYNDSVEEIYEKIMDIINDPIKYEHMKRVASEKGKDVFSYRRIAERSIKDSC